MTTSISAPLSVWVFFHLLVVGALAFDLIWLHKKPHSSSKNEALAWTGFWSLVALLGALYIYQQWGSAKALDFATGYLLELSLSMDNVFVFYLIFRSFRIAAAHQHRILFWGILGAFVMRAVMIVAGIELLHTVSWTSYVLGAILVVSGIKIMGERVGSESSADTFTIRLVKRLLPIKDHTHSGHFFVREGGRWHTTSLFLALIAVECADLVFAIDSVPAVLAITHDFFIVYTSNVLAILSLRSLYFLISRGADFLPYLHKGLALVLIFVGAKFVFSHHVEIPSLMSLAVIIALIGGSVVLSVLKNRRV
jgi:tellurite resistance protein TerC